MVGSGARTTAFASTPSSAQSPNAPSPKSSSPTAVRKATSAPKASGADCLVRALAAVVVAEQRPDHGLAALGERAPSRT